MFSPTEWKGSYDGISALLIAKEKFSNFSAVLFGVSARGKGIPNWIEYIRNPPQEYLVREIYNKCSIFMAPSWSEGWALPPAEAMACGCAVVATDIGGFKDYAIDMKTAILSPPRDPEKLAQNLLNLLENDELRIQLAEEGHRMISTFSWDNSTLLLESFIRKYVSKE